MISHIGKEEKKVPERYYWRQGAFGGSNTIVLLWSLDVHS